MRRRLAFPPPETSPPSPLEAIRSASRALERAKQARDAAIRSARAQHHPFREIAAVAGLGVTRVQQIAGGPGSGDYPGRAPVTELDTSGWRAGADADVDQEDRVVALATVAPWLPESASERAFIAERPERAHGQRYDFSFSILDLEPPGRWVVTYIDSTREVYAFETGTPGAGGRGDTPPPEDPQLGSSAGPCKLLGHAFSYKLLDAGLGTAIGVAANRPGGLAWVYGRVQLLNRVLAASPGRAKDIDAYLASLPSDQRSN